VLQITDIPLSEYWGNTFSRSIASLGEKSELIDNDYLIRMAQPGSWGDGAVLAMAARRYNRIVEVVMAGGKVISFSMEQQPPDDAGDTPPVPLCLGFVKSRGSLVKKPLRMPTEKARVKHEKCHLSQVNGINRDYFVVEKYFSPAKARSTLSRLTSFMLYMHIL